ncbi:MAG: hypothetical protein AAF757_23485, partial [Cyanobacteria bacterium P01_D01_bin.116]
KNLIILCRKIIMSNNGYTVRENLSEFEESILEDLNQGYDLVDVAYGEALRCGGSLRCSKC